MWLADGHLGNALTSQNIRDIPSPIIPATNMAAAPRPSFAWWFRLGGRFFENTVTSAVDLASIRYVRLHGNARSCRLGLARPGTRVTCGFRKLLRAGPSRPASRARRTYPSTWWRDRRYPRDERTSRKKCALARRAAGESGRAEKSPHGKHAWPRKAAEKTTLRARANYARD